MYKCYKINCIKYKLNMCNLEYIYGCLLLIYRYIYVCINDCILYIYFDLICYNMRILY